MHGFSNVPCGRLPSRFNVARERSSTSYVNCDASNISLKERTVIQKTPTLKQWRLKVNGIQVIHKLLHQRLAGLKIITKASNEKVIIQQGDRKTPIDRVFTELTVFDRDIEVPLCDGRRFRADVFRPNTEQ